MNKGRGATGKTKKRSFYYEVRVVAEGEMIAYLRGGTLGVTREQR